MQTFYTIYGLRLFGTCALCVLTYTDVYLALDGGFVQRRVVPVVSSIRVGPLTQQQGHHLRRRVRIFFTENLNKEVAACQGPDPPFFFTLEYDTQTEKSFAVKALIQYLFKGYYIKTLKLLGASCSPVCQTGFSTSKN